MHYFWWGVGIRVFSSCLRELLPIILTPHDVSMSDHPRGPVKIHLFRFNEWLQFLFRGLGTLGEIF